MHVMASGHILAALTALVVGASATADGGGHSVNDDLQMMQTRVRQGQKEASMTSLDKMILSAKESTRWIGPVPVLNALSADKHEGFVSKGANSEDIRQFLFMVLFKEGVAQRRISDFCLGCKAHCVEGNSTHGLPIAHLNLTESALEKCVNEQVNATHNDISFIEYDGAMVNDPNIPVVENKVMQESMSMLQKEDPVEVVATARTQKAESWGLDRVDARSGLNFQYSISGESRGGEGIHIYVCDTGIYCLHDDFEKDDGEVRCIPTMETTADVDFFCNTLTFDSPEYWECGVDRNGHGSHVSGSAAGKTYGVAPDSTIHAIKVLGDDRGGSISSFSRGLDWVAAKGARPAVVGASLGAKGKFHIVEKLIEKVSEAGVTVVVAAGNEGANACKFTPAYIPLAITVASTDRYDFRSFFSNWGPCIDLFAPGSDIMSIRPGATRRVVEKESGTSMATPHVAGGVALLLGKNGTLFPEAIWAALDCDSTPNKVNGADGDEGGGEDDLSPNKFLYVRGGCLRDDGSIAPVDVSSLPFNVEDRRRRIPVFMLPTRPPPTKFVLSKDDAKKIADLQKAASGAMNCFPGDATVQVRGRGHTALSSVEVGDYVLVKGAEEPVLGFLHLLHGGQTKADFLTVVLSQGEFRATANHLVFVAGQDKAVDQLEVGDKFDDSTVLAIRHDTGSTGMFAPVTQSGTVVVDGVLASSYATPGSRLSLPHSAAHSVFFPLRMYHRFGGWLSGQDSVEQLHPYAQAVQAHGQIGQFYKVFTS